MKKSAFDEWRDRHNDRIYRAWAVARNGHTGEISIVAEGPKPEDLPPRHCHCYRWIINTNYDSPASDSIDLDTTEINCFMLMACDYPRRFYFAIKFPPEMRTSIADLTLRDSFEVIIRPYPRDEDNTDDVLARATAYVTRRDIVTIPCGAAPEMHQLVCVGHPPAVA